MRSILKKVIEEKNLLKLMEEEAEVSKKEMKSRIKNAKSQYRISEEEFYQRKLYRFTEEELKHRYRNINIPVVADILGVSYEAARRKMYRVKKEYHITYTEYADNRLYLCKNKSELEDKVGFIERAKKRSIDAICADTGWSYDEALEKAERVRKEFGQSYLKYATYRFFEKSDDQIRADVERWHREAENYRSIVMRESGWSEEQVRRHMRKVKVLFDLKAAYYVLYRAWELTDEELSGYARQELSLFLWRKYNDSEEAKILSQKDRFDTVFRDFIKRKSWVNQNSNYQEFLRFIQGLEYVFCKPISFGGGLNTSKFKIDHQNPKMLYDQLMEKERMLIEECVMQHTAMDEFLPGCVNTIRVVTLLDEDEICHIICAGARFGHKGITDNFSKDGMVADVDPKTGVIRTDAIDKKGTTYEVHPITGKKFLGFQIPRWEEVLKTAEEAIRFLPGVNYAGWDMAVCEDKVVIIEGNSMPDLVLVQAPYARAKIGKKYLFEPYLAR